jgi:hypothetical protein
VWTACCLLVACGRFGFGYDREGDDRGSGGDDDGGSAVGDTLRQDGADPQPSSLIFYYALEDDPNVGGADDSSGNGRTAPCLNPSPCPLLWDLDDTRGTSRICDFEDGTLRVPQDAAIGATSSGFTISLWAEVENAGGCLVAMPGAWKLCAVGTTNVTFTITANGTSLPASVGAGWNHIALSWNGTTGTLYVNGMARSTGGAPLAAPAAGAVIGASDAAGTTERVDGWMDDIRLHGVALTAADILALYQQN